MKFFQRRRINGLIMFILAVLAVVAAVMFARRWLKRSFSSVERIFPSEIYRNQGFDALSAGKLDEAVDAFNKSLEEYATSSETRLGRGAAYYKQEKFEQAILDFTRVIETRSSRVDEAYFYRGLVYDNRGELDKALADYSAALERKQNQPSDIYFLRGVIYSKKGQLQEALTDYLAALKIEVGHAILNNYMPRYYMTGNKDFERVLDDCTKMIVSTGDVSWYIARGGAYFIKKDYDAAIRDFIKAATEAPQNHKSYILLGVTYTEKGSLDEAIEAYTKAIELTSDNAISHIGRAKAFLQKGLFDKVIADCTAAIEKTEYVPGPLLGGALTLRAKAYRGKNQIDKAEKDEGNAMTIFY